LPGIIPSHAAKKPRENFFAPALRGVENLFASIIALRARQTRAATTCKRLKTCEKVKRARGDRRCTTRFLCREYAAIFRRALRVARVFLYRA
jgi:hypothetical protein